MTKAEKLKAIPNSGEYEEIVFDLPGEWKEEAWNFVKFTQSDGTEWCGEFREKQDSNFLLADLPDKGIACVVSGGHGYIIDIDKKEKIRDINTEIIIDLFADILTNTFYISSWWALIIIDNEWNEIGIPIPIQCDGIFFKGNNDRKLKLEIEEIGAGMTKNFDYYVDLNDRKTKKNAV